MTTELRALIYLLSLHVQHISVSTIMRYSNVHASTCKFYLHTDLFRPT